MATLLVTGGAGFIGSALVRRLLGKTGHKVVNIDKLTYAASALALESVSANPRYRFYRRDICDAEAMQAIFRATSPDAVLHLAAESHVDRSIDGPETFIRTNVTGTFTLLQAARRHLDSLPGERAATFRFLHVSTDEVYGSLGATGRFTEASPYAPNSPYSASKAASDHLVRAWGNTYGLPILITNCSNNYGPYHFPEKLVPLMLLNALEGRPLPVYGDGRQVRDWLHVDDHARALLLVLEKGRPGATYNIGGDSERTNLELVRHLCALLEELAPARPPGAPSYASLIRFVRDRPGHDRRYAMDAGRLKRELGWRPRETFESGMRKTVAWYLANLDWCRRVEAGGSARRRLGLAETAEAAETAAETLAVPDAGAGA